MSEDDNISEIESIRDELSDLLREDPLLVEIQEMLERRDLISAEIDQRSVSSSLLIPFVLVAVRV